MPAIIRPTDAQQPSFNFVLIRPDKDPMLPWLEVAYEETAEACPVELRGRLFPGIFVRTEPLRDRAVKLGWSDVTREWRSATTAGDPTDFTDAEFAVPVSKPRKKRTTPRK